MSTRPPLHFRKQPTYEDGDYTQLSIYVRGIGEMIRKFCNDQGYFALAGRTPVEAVAHRCGAHKGDRRTLAADIDTLVKSGFLRLTPMALVVVEQEEFWSELDSTRSTRTERERNTTVTRTEHDRDANGTRQRREPYVRNELSTQNHSEPICRQDERREEERRSEEKKEDLSPGGDAGVVHDSDSPPTTPSLDQLETPARRSMVQVEPADPPENSTSECDSLGPLPGARPASSRPAPTDAAKIQPAQVPLLVLETQEPTNLSTPLLRVWEAYVEARLAAVKGSRRATLDDKRKTLIKLWLKTFSEEDLIAAVNGVFKDPFHIEKNFKHANIELALRSAANIERFINENNNRPFQQAQTNILRPQKPLAPNGQPVFGGERNAPKFIPPLPPDVETLEEKRERNRKIRAAEEARKQQEFDAMVEREKKQHEEETLALSQKAHDEAGGE